MTTMEYAAEYLLVYYTPSLLSGQTAVVQCRITNRGEKPWELEGDRPVNVAYRWTDERGHRVVPDGRRTRFRRPVEPGETVDCSVIVEPPLLPGSYTLQIDLVAEQHAWFGDMGLPTLDLNVAIQPLDEDRLRVCIVNTNCLLNDAVGNCVVEQLKYFESQNHVVHVLAEHIDERLPLDVRRSVFCTSLAEVQEGSTVAARSWIAQQFYQADLYIFHYPVYYPLVEAIRLVQSGTIIFDYHGLTPPHLWGDGSGMSFLVQGQKKATLARLADYAIVHSQYMAEELQSYSGVDPERIRVMPYAVPVSQFRPMPRDPELVAHYGLEGRRVLLYIGRMAGNKRIDDLVRMLAVVRQTLPETTLMLVGDNKFSVYKQICDQALAIAEDLGCAEQVVFTGPVNHEELYRYYNLCDVYVTSSLHEGFCVPVIEAMACGRPVVATDATALPETVGDAGLLFPAEDVQAMAGQVTRILTSIALRAAAS